MGYHLYVSLTVAGCIIELTADNTENSSCVMTKLKALVVKDVAFPNVPCSNVDQSNNHMCYIARKCPVLSSLEIDGEVQDSTRLFKVEFPHFMLASVDINIKNMQYYNIYNEKYIAWYKHDESGKLTSYREVPDLKDKSYVSIVYEGCYTNVKIGDYEIYANGECCSSFQANSNKALCLHQTSFFVSF
ncbi:hypothetical protein MBANPS3_002653 [Mucor bainieri]